VFRGFASRVFRRHWPVLIPGRRLQSSRRDPALIQFPVEDTLIGRRYGSFGSPVPILFLFAVRKSPLNCDGGRQPIEARGSRNPARFNDEHAAWVKSAKCSFPPDGFIAEERATGRPWLDRM